MRPFPLRLASFHALLLSTAALTVPAAAAEVMAAQPVPDAVTAQPAPPAEEEPEAEALPAVTAEDIVVTAARLPGSVISEVPPDEVLDETAIASFGASNLTDLVAQLAVQTRGNRGRGGGQPVVLLNGRRVSGFQEIRNLPPEAIQRVEIFPEEVALEYGFSADQRVINFILRQNFAAVFGEVEGGAATAGGYGNYELEASWLQLTGRSRINLTINYEANSPVTEAERDILVTRAVPLTLTGAVTGAGGGEIDPALSALAGRAVTLAGVPAGGGTLGQFAALADRVDGIEDGSRTLVAGQGVLTIDGTFARPLSPGSGISANLRYVRTDNDSVLGLSPIDLTIPVGAAGSPFTRPVQLSRVVDANPLLSDTDIEQIAGGASADGRAGAWRWTVTGNFARNRTTQITDLGIDIAALQSAVNAGTNAFATTLTAATLTPERTRSVVQSGDINTILSGGLVELPAGDVRTTLQVGFDRLDLDGRSERGGVTALTDLGRSIWSASSNIDVPVASRNNDVLAFIGDLSLSGRVAWRDVSDFGGLINWNAGVNWEPVDRVRLIATWFGEENAPGLNQLGAPLQVTPLRVVYDFVRNETALVTVTTGGNPALLAEERRDFRAQFNWQPIADLDLNFTASYARTRSTNTTASFPLLTAEIEAAFPDRVTRDADGRLVAVDQRPVNFAATRGRQIRYGLTFARSFGQPQRGSGGPGGMFGGARPPGAPAAPPAAPVTPGAGTPTPGGPPAGARPGRGGPGGGRGPGGGGFGMFGGGPGGMGGRWDVQVFHTVRFEDEIFIRPGVPVLDLLDGSATGESGGSPRHEVELSGGRFFRGIGFRLNTVWRAPTRVDGTVIPGGGTSDDLRFGSTFIANARLFVDFNQQAGLVRAIPFLRNSRIRLSVDNIFNDIRTVRDESGAVPLRYQPGYVDPLGRTFEISFRRQF